MPHSRPIRGFHSPSDRRPRRPPPPAARSTRRARRPHATRAVRPSLPRQPGRALPARAPGARPHCWSPARPARCCSRRFLPWILADRPSRSHQERTGRTGHRHLRLHAPGQPLARARPSSASMIHSSWPWKSSWRDSFSTVRASSGGSGWFASQERPVIPNRPATGGRGTRLRGRIDCTWLLSRVRCLTTRARPAAPACSHRASTPSAGSRAASSCASTSAPTSSVLTCRYANARVFIGLEITSRAARGAISRTIVCALHVASIATSSVASDCPRTTRSASGVSRPAQPGAPDRPPTPRSARTRGSCVPPLCLSSIERSLGEQAGSDNTDSRPQCIGVSCTGQVLTRRELRTKRSRLK